MSVVIPTHNRKQAVTRCVESILRSNYERLEIIVVDDASTDQTFEHLCQSYPSIIVVRNEDEKLLAGSRNVGCKLAKGELVFLIDDDNVVHPNAITELTKAIFGNPRIGIVGPIMYYLHNPGLVWCSGATRNYLTSITRKSTSKPDGSNCYPTEDIPNAFMVRKSVFTDIGYFDQIAFSQHLDEADFGRRATRKGYQIIMVPNATIWHDVPLRHRLDLGLRDLHMTTPTRAYYVGRNRILFMRKYTQPLQFIFFTIAFLPVISLAHIIAIFNERRIGDRRKSFAKSYIRGLIEGFSLKI